MIELRQLRYFVAVAEERHFGRAARRVGIAQSPLSQAIAKLETSLDARLLERSSRSVELTAAGAAFLVAARETLAEAERAVLAVNATAVPEHVPVRVAATPGARLAVVPAVTGELVHRAPGLVVNAVELSEPAVVAAVAAHEADIGFAVDPIVAPGVAAEVVRREPAVVVVGRRNPLARSRRVTLARAAEQPLAVWPRSSAPGFHSRVIEILRAAGAAPRVVDHPAAGADWGGVLAEEGVALAPSGWPEIPEAVRLPLVDAPTFETSVLWRAGDDRPLVTATLAAARACALARAWLADGRSDGR